MLYLSTDPHQHDRTHLLYYIDDPIIENLLLINYRTHHHSLQLLNDALTRSFQQIRPDYLPIEHRNRITHLHTFDQIQINELTNFNTELTRALRDEDRVYLIANDLDLA